MKQIVIAGNVGKNAEIRTAGQNKVTGWSVGVDDGWGDKKTTIWFDCNWWGQRGEKVAQYIQKGDKITVSGELSKREHEGKTYLTINVTDVKLQGGNGGGSGHSQQSNGGYDAPSGGGYDQGSNAGGGRDLDDDLPFAPEWRI